MIRTVLKIDGMYCSMCEAHINDVIRENFKVKKVSSSHSKGECEIISERPLDREEVKKAVGNTGYRVLSFESGEYRKKKFSLFG